MRINLLAPGMLLSIVFTILKLTNVVAWSWWWITAPLWIPLGIALVLIIFAALLLGAVNALK